MTNQPEDRQTIICPKAMMRDANDALGLSMQAANWRDAAGNSYAAASLVPDVLIGPDALPGLPSIFLDHDTPVSLREGHIHVVSGLDGAMVMEKLGLTARLPMP